MADWTCRKCNGEGMYPSEDGSKRIVCDCPVGRSKRRYLNMTPEERRAAKKKRSGSKKRKEDQEPIPF
jgi:hypothetical protein